MTESLNGLRFDIYERVHLSEDVAAIEELEEIELIPHMQAVSSEDQIVLKGHLLLTGTYRSTDEQEAARRLEHWIPVEISLPPNRIEKLEDLAVEIDNFDVDLLSARSLNVTGVLGLKGLQVSAPPPPVWRDDSFTVVHQLPPDAFAEPAAAEKRAEEPPDRQQTSPFAQHVPLQQPPESGPEPVRREQPAQPSAEAGPAAADNDAPATAQAAEAEPAGEYKSVGAAQEPNADGGAVPEDESANDAAPLAQPSGESRLPPQREDILHVDVSNGTWSDAIAEAEAAKAEAPSQPEAVPEEKPAMKVAFGAKPAAETASASSGVGLLSQFGNKTGKSEPQPSATVSEAKGAPADAAAAANAAANADPAGDSSGDEVEWTRLFLSKEAGEPSFRKVKLCIVQKEDTLDAIASRYNIQPRELQLYNRLNDPHVSEGQILYIPS